MLETGRSVETTDGFVKVDGLDNGFISVSAVVVGEVISDRGIIVVLDFSDVRLYK